MFTRILALTSLTLFLTSCLVGGTDDEPATSTATLRPPTATPASSSPTPMPSANAVSTPTATPIEDIAAATLPLTSVDVYVFSRPYTAPGIFVMDTDGRNVRQINPDGVMEAREPGWSPDGSQIVFEGYDGNDDGIFVMHADGTNVRRVSDGDGSSSEPGWSPDGTQIAFVRQHLEPGGTHLYVINQDGSELRQLTNLSGSVAAPAWSPDSQRIAFVSNYEGDDVIYLIDVSGERLQRLIDKPTYDYGPTWSADGERIMFTASAYGSTAETVERSALGTFTINADGSGLERLDILRFDDSEPRWAPDGSRIAFVHDGEITLVASAGGTRLNLTQHPLLDRSPRWSPDGRTLLFVSDRSTLAPAKEGKGKPHPIVFHAGGAGQEGGFGNYCQPIENGMRGSDIVGVRLPETALTAAPGEELAFDFSALGAPFAFEITFYDYELAEDLGKLVGNVLTPYCAPPSGTEADCIVEQLTGPAGVEVVTYQLDLLPPGRYALSVRAIFSVANRQGYTEQGFHLVVE